MFRKLSYCLAVFALTAVVSLTAYAQQSDETESTTWGRIKAGYRTEDPAKAVPLGITEQTIKRLQEAQTEEEALSIIESAPADVREMLMSESAAAISTQPAPPAWTHPVAAQAISKFNLNSSDVLAVQRVVALENGVPIDSADVVVTEERWYYSSLTTGELTDTPSGGFLRTTEMDIYGSGVEQTPPDAYWCWNDEWVVTMYLPVCFYEDDRFHGHFDGIIDAWAPTPCCDPLYCNGGRCALFQCGCAWIGPGYNGWWDYNTCGDRWSKKVGKQVQKRWLHTWQLCYHRSDQDIARSVRARIRY
ncbi:MAG: hypothetical protein WC497_02730 [Patescibacteria group bacterium]